jgi:hypothetical protein
VVRVTFDAIVLTALVAGLPTGVLDMALMIINTAASLEYIAIVTYSYRVLLRHLCIATRTNPSGNGFVRLTSPETECFLVGGVTLRSGQ